VHFAYGYFRVIIDMEKAASSCKQALYRYFLRTVNQAYKRKYEDSLFIFGDFSAMCSQKWHTLNQDEKDCLQRRAKEVQGKEYFTRLTIKISSELPI
jgi:hypothetical protein